MYRINYTARGLIIRRVKYQRRRGVPEICTRVECQKCAQTSRQHAMILLDVWERSRMTNEHRT